MAQVVVLRTENTIRTRQRKENEGYVIHEWRKFRRQNRQCLFIPIAVQRRELWNDATGCSVFQEAALERTSIGLEDSEGLRPGMAYMNTYTKTRSPDPTTVSNFTRRFAEADVVMLMEFINAIRPALWSRRGAERLRPITYLESMAPTYGTVGSAKQGMDISGHACDRWAHQTGLHLRHGQHVSVAHLCRDLE